MKPANTSAILLMGFRGAGRPRLVVGVCAASAVFVMLLLGGCGAASSEQQTQTVPVDSVVASEDSVVTDSEAVALVDEADSEAPPLPAPKADATLEKLHADRKAAAAAERKLFMTTRLDQWLAELSKLEGRDEWHPIEPLQDDLFKSMTAQEKLAYLLIHPEDYAQICKGFAPVEGESEAIFRKLPRRLDDADVSERQMLAVRLDSNAVKKLILNSLETNKAVSVDLMRVIVELKVISAIPALVRIYEAQTTKDDLILTTLVQLMEHSNFWKWTYSDLNKALLVDYYEAVPLTEANIEVILTMARELAAKR